MDYKDILKILAAANQTPDKTSLISALSAGGDMSAILPFLMGSAGKKDANVVVNAESKDVKLPSDDEIKEALLKLSETQNKI